MPFPVVHFLHLYEHYSEPEHEVDPFLFQGQILIQAIDLLQIYDRVYPYYLFMVSSQEEKQGGDLGDEQGGHWGSKVKSIHLHNPAFLLHSTVVVSYTMVHGYYIGYQDMGIWCSFCHTKDGVEEKK